MSKPLKISESDMCVNTHVSFVPIGIEIPGVNDIRFAWYANPDLEGKIGIAVPPEVKGEEVMVRLADLQAVCSVAQLLEDGREEKDND